MDVQGILEHHNVQVSSKEETTPLLASVDFNLRVVIQEAMKFTRHSKRTRLMPSDVNKALRCLSSTPAYGGPSSRDPLAVPLATLAREHALGSGNDAAMKPFTSNQRVFLNDLKRVDLPRLPVEPSLVASWLAVEGHQTGVPTTKKKRKRQGGGQSNVNDNSSHVVVDPGVYHSISHQQRKLLADLLSKITPLNQVEEEEEEEETRSRRTSALRVVSSSTGLQPLLPYFVHHITTTIHANLKKLHALRSMLHFTSALLANSNVDLELYLDQVLPCIFSCLVGKRISQSHLDDHWSVRDCAAVVLSTIVDRYGRKYPDLSSRIMNTLCCALWRDNRPRTTEYGAIVGLTALGSMTIEHLVLPRAAEYLSKANMDEKNILEGGNNDSRSGSGSSSSSSSSSNNNNRSSKSSDSQNNINLINIRKCKLAMYRATHVFSKHSSKMKASNDLLRILKDLEKTHNMKKSGTDSMNPIHALREAAGEALLPFTMSCRSSDASDSFI